MIAGTVTVADDGTVTKSGAAEAYYDALVLALADLHGFTAPAGTAGVPYKRGLAASARATAALITYVLVNGHAKVATTDAALQRTPNPNTPDTDTQGPAADKFLVLI